MHCWHRAATCTRVTSGMDLLWALYLFCTSLNGFIFLHGSTFLSSGPPPTPGAVSPPESSCRAGGWELWGGWWEKRWFLSSRFVTEVSSQNGSKSGRQELCAYCLSLIRPCAYLTLKDKNTVFLLHVFSAVSIAELVLSHYCILTTNNNLWGHFISKSARMIPLSPHCSFSNS